MRPSRRILVIAAALLATIAILTAAVPRAFDARDADAGVIPALSLLIDCDVVTLGVQSDCTFPGGAASVDVAIVLQNNGPAFDLGFFNTTVRSTPRSVFVPIEPVCSGTAINCNPDFNELSLVSPDWHCGPPYPRGDRGVDGDPNTSESYIGCFISPNLGGVDTIPADSETRLAIVSFNVIGDIYAEVSVQNTEVYDSSFNEVGSCLPPLSVPMECGTATLQVGSNPTTPTPTLTQTSTPTPTFTPVPQLTPSGTPTGAVTDIVALNEGVCIAAASVHGVPATTAAFSCTFISEQSYVQMFVDCLVVSGFCPRVPGPNEVFRRPQPSDFDSINLDADSTQQDMPLEVIAFVDGDYPVLFETNLGTFLTPQGETAGQSLICAPGSPQYPGASLDPDCDADLATTGDGVVAIRLVADTTDPRGVGTVTVTQNGVSKQLQFTVTGRAKTISFETLDGKDEIETAGAGPCTAVFTDPVTGSTSPDKTNLFVRALDEDGVPVFGASVLWDKVYGRADAPLGGSASFGSPTWLFAGRGAGAVLTICGGHALGTLTVEGRFNVLFGGDYAYRSSITMQVVPAPNFCVDIGAPWQRNQDSEIMELANDVTNPAGDFVIDDCDRDMDGDGVPNDQESVLGTFADYWDSDFDLTSDGAEVNCRSNPLSSADNISGTDTDNDRLPDSCEALYEADPARSDTDGDGLLDGVEVRYWLTNPHDVNTDGDDCSDGREVATINKDRSVNIADYGILASSFGPIPLYRRPRDQNGDGVINIADLAFVASKFGRCSVNP